MENNKVFPLDIKVDATLYIELLKLSAVTGKSKDLLVNEAIYLLCKKYSDIKTNNHVKPLASR